LAAQFDIALSRKTNWTLRPYTGLSNGFSRKVENHMAAVPVNYFAYNFIKIHNTLRTTSAMAAGVTTRSRSESKRAA